MTNRLLSCLYNFIWILQNFSQSPWIIKAIGSQWSIIVGAVNVVDRCIGIRMWKSQKFSNLVGPLALIINWISSLIVIFLIIIVQVPEIGSSSTSFAYNINHLLITPNSCIWLLARSSNISTTPTLGANQNWAWGPTVGTNLAESVNPLLNRAFFSLLHIGLTKSWAIRQVVNTMVTPTRTTLGSDASSLVPLRGDNINFSRVEFSPSLGTVWDELGTHGNSSHKITIGSESSSKFVDCLGERIGVGGLPIDIDSIPINSSLLSEIKETL